MGTDQKVIYWHRNNMPKSSWHVAEQHSYRGWWNMIRLLACGVFHAPTQGERFVFDGHDLYTCHQCHRTTEVVD